MNMNYETIKTICDNCDLEDTITIKIKDLKSIIDELYKLKEELHFHPAHEFYSMRLIDYKNSHRIEKDNYTTRFFNFMTKNFGENIRFRDLVDKDGYILKEVYDIKGVGHDAIWGMKKIYKENGVFIKDRWV